MSSRGERRKVLSIVGARPQCIKAAVVSQKIRRCGAGFEELLLHTGRHDDFHMSEVFFREPDPPPPNYYLGIGAGHASARIVNVLQWFLHR